jgi:hypothetical protein
VLWAGSIAASLSVGKAGMPFYQRLIDARIFAQWMTVFAAVSVGVAGVAFPDDREMSQFRVDEDPFDRRFQRQTTLRQSAPTKPTPALTQAADQSSKQTQASATSATAAPQQDVVERSVAAVDAAVVVPASIVAVKGQQAPKL